MVPRGTSAQFASTDGRKLEVCVPGVHEGSRLLDYELVGCSRIFGPRVASSNHVRVIHLFKHFLLDFVFPLLVSQRSRQTVMIRLKSLQRILSVRVLMILLVKGPLLSGRQPRLLLVGLE